MTYLICLLTIVIPGGIYSILRFLTKIFTKERIVWLLRTLAILALGVFIVRYFSTGTTLFTEIFGMKSSEENPQFSSSFTCVMADICVWFEFMTVIIVVLYPFFMNKYPIFMNYAKYLGLFSCVLNIVFLRWSGFAFTGDYALNLTSVMLAIEIALVTLLCLYPYSEKDGYKISKKEGKEMGIYLPVILLFSIPFFFFQPLTGNLGQYRAVDFDFYHRVYLYAAVVIVIGMYFLLRKRDREFIRMMLLYVSLSMLTAYFFDKDFNWFASPSEYPLGIIDLCMILIPLCLLVKCKWLYYFTFLVGSVGAFVMMFMPSYSANYGFFYAETMQFWIAQIAVFTLPILMVMCRVYERPQSKDLGVTIGVLAAYVIVASFLSGWFSGLYGECDFAYLNSAYLASQIGMTSFFNNNVWTFYLGEVATSIHHWYVLAYFGVYAVFTVIVYYLFVWIFSVQDYFTNIENINHKIRVDEYMKMQEHPGEKAGEIMNEESVDKLVVKHLYKRYSRSKVLSVEDANFEVRGGEILGFLGHNGAGKSTIIKCIVGIQPPSSGSVEINGYDIAKEPEEAKMQIGFVPDHYALYEKLTGREYINYVADLYKVSKEDRDERLERLCNNLSMTKAIDNPINTYSHGMKQKTAIMAALIHEPKLWILDEPLTGLDPTSIYEVKECMKEHAAKGNIVFFSSHLIDVVEKLCDRIIMIKEGHILLSEPLADIEAEHSDLEQFYLDVNATPVERRVVNDKEFKKITKGEPNDSYFFKTEDKEKKVKVKKEKAESQETSAE
ncbi:MAG: ATP-binding cassette domain-containing protein [Coprobacillus sp.]|nr:ATP-binding cassette domain-containing protein [Coprobacillus sp.]